MRTHSFIKIILLGLLLLGANVGPRALAQDSGALRNIQIDDYFAIQGAPDR